MVRDSPSREHARNMLAVATLDRQRAKLSLYDAVTVARAAGMTFHTIAEILNVAERTVRRVVEDGYPGLPVISTMLDDLARHGGGALSVHPISEVDSITPSES